MAKQGWKGEDSLMSPETGNWNVASDYAKLKIMKHLYLSDEYEVISTFGTSTLVEELQLTFNPDFLRIRAFRRLVKTLIMLIDNSIFAIKHKQDRKDLKEDRKTLVRIYKILPALFKITRDNIKKTSEVSILKEKYDPILQEVIKIKSDINLPLNRSDLLFLDREEFDPRRSKKEIMKRLAEKG